MANLLTEYNKRHGMKCVPPTNDGLCFFNEHKRPALVALTSASPKTYSSCFRCERPDSWITVELFGPSREESFTFGHHDHVHPDIDLEKYVSSQGYSQLSPVYLKSNRDVETWLWQFFLFHHRLRYSRNWKYFAQCHMTVAEPLRTYEQMAWCAMNAPRTYNVYYTMYQTFVVGRKYLLFE